MYCGFEEAYRNEKEMFDSNLKYVITEVLPKKSKCFTKEYFENHWIPTFC